MSTEREPKVHRTKEEKLLILREGSANGVAATCRKFGIYEASYYQWKNKFQEMGDAGLQHGMTKAQRVLSLMVFCPRCLLRN